MDVPPQKDYAWLGVRDSIRKAISDCTYRPGDRIPTVSELGRRYGVSASTVRRALASLASEGAVEIRQGYGTIVSPPRLDYEPGAGFHEQAGRLGARAQTELREMRWIVPGPAAQRALNMRANQRAWETVQVHYIDGAPVVAERFIIPKKIAAQVFGDTSKLLTLSQSLKERFGHAGWRVNIASVRVTGGNEHARLLDSPGANSFFHVERLFYCGGSPLMLGSLVLRTDRFNLQFNGLDNSKKKQEGGSPSNKRKEVSGSRKQPSQLRM